MALFNVAGETDRSLFLDIELRKDLNLYDKASELCGECGGVIGNSLFLGIAIGLMWVFDSCSSDVISGVLDKFWQKTLSRLALLRLMSNISVNLDLYDISFFCIHYSREREQKKKLFLCSNRFIWSDHLSSWLVTNSGSSISIKLRKKSRACATPHFHSYVISSWIIFTLNRMFLLAKA